MAHLLPSTLSESLAGLFTSDHLYRHYHFVSNLDEDPRHISAMNAGTFAGMISAVATQAVLNEDRRIRNIGGCALVSIATIEGLALAAGLVQQDPELVEATLVMIGSTVSGICMGSFCHAGLKYANG